MSQNVFSTVAFQTNICFLAVLTNTKLLPFIIFNFPDDMTTFVSFVSCQFFFFGQWCLILGMDENSFEVSLDLSSDINQAINRDPNSSLCNSSSFINNFMSLHWWLFAIQLHFHLQIGIIIDLISNINPKLCPTWQMEPMYFDLKFIEWFLWNLHILMRIKTFKFLLLAINEGIWSVGQHITFLHGFYIQSRSCFKK